ncbi:MAG TPA: TetR/AcrR family transcriptional regulator [Candidatus Bathyarchaeia archaeon]|nr:TetR/AcrR family transcriptional regulator [Candidatus Bathyarchaeia archaeon]
MQNHPNMSSKEKLMIAAIDLISEKGYKAVTTKEIAETAGLSEKTLFRLFGTKQNLLEAAFDRFHYAEEMKQLFANKITWDLQTDLLLISRAYHESMNRNRKLIMISIKEEANLPGFREITQHHPRQLMALLTQYFKEMHERGKVRTSRPELSAMTFMMMSFGAFMNNLETEENFSDVTLDSFIEESVELFTRALQS